MSWRTEPPAVDTDVRSNPVVRWPPDFSEVTPVKAAVWSAMAMLAVAAGRVVVQGVLLNPAVWMYASWWLVVWPIPAAVTLGVATAVIAGRQVQGKAREWEQIVMLGGAMVWLILVPLGAVHGYVDGWPLVLCSIYILFYLVSALVRLRLYGELSSRPSLEDQQWASSPSRLAQAGFIMSAVAGHWAAALEAQPLLLSWNFSWTSKFAAGLLLLAFVTQWNAVYFLAKYSDRLVRPRAVVMFGPYRWVRHPIYASYMLLFAGYCVALRSYWSLLFLSVACFHYYEQRTRVEEDKLVDTFGNLYTSYRSRVKNKYLPFLV